MSEPLRHDEPRTIQNLNSFSAILLASFTIASFSANVFLIVTILSSQRLRNYVINYFILNLALVNLIDTAFNMVFTLIYISMGVADWRLGETLCNVNAFFGLLVIIMSMLGLVLLNVDRAIALLDLSKYRQRLSSLRSLLAIGLAWIIGISFTFPIAIGNVEAIIYPARYFCAVAPGNDMAYSICLLIFICMIPLLVVLLALGMIFFKARLDRLQKRSTGDLRFTSDYIVEARRFQQQLALSKFAVTLFILFMLLQGPYIVLNYIGLLRNSKQVIKTSDDKIFYFPSDAETGITWLKFVFPVVYPFLVFGFCKDIWKKFQDLICCKRSNMIQAKANTASSDLPGDDFRPENIAESRVPTLIATAGGLHLRTTQFDDDGRLASDDYAYADLRQRQRLPSERYNPERVLERGATSDYDSEDSDSWADLAEGGHRSNRSRIIDGSNQVIEGNMQKWRMEIRNTGTQCSRDFQSRILSGQQTSSSSLLDVRVDDSSLGLKRTSSDPVMVVPRPRTPPNKPMFRKFGELQRESEQANIDKSMRKISEEPLLSRQNSEPTVSINEPTVEHGNPGEIPRPGSPKLGQPIYKANRLPPLQAGISKPINNGVNSSRVQSLDFGLNSPPILQHRNSEEILNRMDGGLITRYANRLNERDITVRERVFVPESKMESKVIKPKARKSTGGSDIFPRAIDKLGHRKVVSADMAISLATNPSEVAKGKKFRPLNLGEAPTAAWKP